MLCFLWLVTDGWPVPRAELTAFFLILTSDYPTLHCLSCAYEKPHRS